MLTAPYSRTAYLTHLGKRRRHPRYTFGDLVADLEQYAPEQLFLWTESSCVEITPEIAVELAAQRMKARHKTQEVTACPLLLIVPRDGVGIICRNPGLRRRSA